MKTILTLIKFLAAVILITFGVNNISQPSNTEVYIGIAEVILGLFIVYQPIANFIKNL
jgi:hypothetical protein